MVRRIGVLVLVGVLVFACVGPSLNCRRACWHVKGEGWQDCIAMCEE